MRKIKFRVWDDDNKGYEYFDITNLQETIEVLNGFYDYFSSNYFSEGDYVEQCTGLKDKNGIEVYEGDIVRYEACGEWGEGSIEHFLHVFHVMWDKNNFKSHDMFTSIKYLGCSKEIEIIGNIHEGSK